MQELEFVFMLTMWNEILHFYQTSQALQEKELDLKTCTNLCQSLADHLHTLRNDFERFEDISKDILPDTNYKEAQSRKQIRKKQANDSCATETAWNPRDKFCVSTYYAIIDTLEAHTKRRGEVYKEVSSRFSFLNNMDLSDEQYSQGSQKLVDSYHVDLNMNLREIWQFHCYMHTQFNETGEMKFSHIDLSDTILKDGIQYAFPNVEIIICIFLTLIISNCSTECSFSQLKRIKTLREQQSVRTDLIHFPYCVWKQTCFVRSASMNLSRILQSENLERNYFNFSIPILPQVIRGFYVLPWLHFKFNRVNQQISQFFHH
ncbi:uncharacterized protein ACDP82_016619 isoform 1-T2 [Pangshura tecta]